ncbi:putative glucose-6-phosphate 1-epimerase [Xenia sp. Carnegie-2017]|uniref:putative glucose-6-phosphate 1-epimerase n=1 Tax=Xenia sp. Carnegie-2017 TaxID=2897299 RepID=UPI001F04F7E2|nr:putative glucose-6-phosphate 1-epimerase [Xenia sp. Carnegie-2017]
MTGELPKLVLKKDEKTAVEVYLHGATVTSWKCKGKEMLFVSKNAVFNGVKAIRGGIPVVFPNFGPWELGPQHGFARTETWKIHQQPEKDESGNIVAALVLEDTEQTRKIWDYNFKFLYTLTLKDDEFSTEVSIENTGTKGFHFTTLVHTYYNVDISKMKLRGLHGCEYIDKVGGGEKKEEREALQISGNVDSVYKNTANELLLSTGDHEIRITKENLPDTVVWNPWIEKAKQMSDFGDTEYKNMVCVEPGYVAKPYDLRPAEVFKAKQTITCLC